MPVNRAIPVLVAWLLVAVLAPAAASQTIRGAVIDEATGASIVGAEVRVHLRGALVGRALTDTSGVFSVELPEGDRYRLAVSRLGYRPADSLWVELGINEEVEVTLRLAADAIALDPITVTARGLALRHQATWEGFLYRYERRRPVGPARLVKRDDPEVRGLMKVRDWVKDIHRGGVPCVFVDGVKLPGWDRVGLEMSLQNVDALEYYRRKLDAPVQYWEDSGCPVLVIWRRRGRSTPMPAALLLAVRRPIHPSPAPAGLAAHEPTLVGDLRIARLAASTEPGRVWLPGSLRHPFNKNTQTLHRPDSSGTSE